MGSNLQVRQPENGSSADLCRLCDLAAPSSRLLGTEDVCLRRPKVEERKNVSAVRERADARQRPPRRSPTSRSSVADGRSGEVGRVTKHKPNWLGKPAAEMHADASHWRDQQPMTTSCAFCPWSFEGTALEGRLAARGHREQHHPEATIRRPRPSRRISLQKLRSAEQQEQVAVDAAAANRVRAEREDAERLAKVLRSRAREAA